MLKYVCSSVWYHGEMHFAVGGLNLSVHMQILFPLSIPEISNLICSVHPQKENKQNPDKPPAKNQTKPQNTTTTKTKKKTPSQTPTQHSLWGNCLPLWREKSIYAGWIVNPVDFSVWDIIAIHKKKLLKDIKWVYFMCFGMYCQDYENNCKYKDTQSLKSL